MKRYSVQKDSRRDLIKIAAFIEPSILEPRTKRDPFIEPSILELDT